MQPIVVAIGGDAALLGLEDDWPAVVAFNVLAPVCLVFAILFVAVHVHIGGFFNAPSRSRDSFTREYEIRIIGGRGACVLLS